MKKILKGDFEWDVIRCDRLIGGNEILIIFYIKSRVHWWRKNFLIVFTNDLIKYSNNLIYGMT